MNFRRIRNEYFDWLCELIPIKTRRSYHELLHYMFNKEFICTLYADENRAADGIELRGRFECETGIILDCISHEKCSVLEMLIGLSIRCEQIMENPEYDDRTGEWFWMMIDNLKLLNMYDRKFDIDHVDHVIDIFLSRKYSPEGDGNIFIIHNSRYDLSTVELWYQMNWYLEDLME